MYNRNIGEYSGFLYQERGLLLGLVIPVDTIAASFLYDLRFAAMEYVIGSFR